MKEETSTPHSFDSLPPFSTPFPAPSPPSQSNGQAEESDPFEMSRISMADRLPPPTPPKPMRALSAPAQLENETHLPPALPPLGGPPSTVPPSLGGPPPTSTHPLPPMTNTATITATQPPGPPPLPPKPPTTSAPTLPPPPRSSGIADKIDDARGWLVQKILGVRKDAHVANTGQRMTAYYDEARRVWCVSFLSFMVSVSGSKLTHLCPIKKIRVFPGDDPNALANATVGPPPITAPADKPPPTARPPGAPLSLKNRYVVE